MTSNKSVSYSASDTLMQLAQRYLAYRANHLTEYSTADNVPPAMTARELTTRLSVECDAIRARGELLRRVNGGYSRVEVAVAPISFDVQGASVAVHLMEETKLYFARPLAGAPTYEEYLLPHRFSFIAVDDTWVLTDAVAEISPGALPPDTQAWRIESVQGGPGPQKEPSSIEMEASPGASAITDKTEISARYNYQAMWKYAERWFHGRNPHFRNYEHVGADGGDCTNFISQIVDAGGWTPVGSWPADCRKDKSKWFYGDHTWTTSYSWPAAENWYWFAMHKSKRTTFLDNVWKMLITDILQADWDRNSNINHSMFVTGRAGTGEYADELYMTYHSTDTHNRRLSSIIAAHGGTWWYAHRT